MPDFSDFWQWLGWFLLITVQTLLICSAIIGKRNK